MQGKSVLKALNFVFCCYSADTLDKQHESSSASCWILREERESAVPLMDAPNRNAITSVCHRVHVRTLPFL